MEVLSSQGITWKRQGNTGTSCIERELSSQYNKDFFTMKTISQEQPSQGNSRYTIPGRFQAAIKQFAY